MKNPNYLFALIFTALLLAMSAQNINAQFGTTPYIKYSNDIFVNSNMHLFFQKRWQVARLRAAGKHQVADAMEGRRTVNDGSPVLPNGNVIKPAPVENPLRRAPLSETSYRPASASIMPAAMLANMQDLPAEDRATAKRLFVSLLENYNEMLTEQKETRLKNNVAGAAAFAILTSRYVLTGTELTEQPAEALLQDVNSLLATAKEFKQTSARERQQMAETLVITAGLSLMLAREGEEKGDAQMQEQARDLAKTIFSQFFTLPVVQIEFTGEGVQFN